jgi:hypothetical protein
MHFRKVFVSRLHCATNFHHFSIYFCKKFFRNLSAKVLITEIIWFCTHVFILVIYASRPTLDTTQSSLTRLPAREAKNLLSLTWSSQRKSLLLSLNLFLRQSWCFSWIFNMWQSFHSWPPAPAPAHLTFVVAIQLWTCRSLCDDCLERNKCTNWLYHIQIIVTLWRNFRFTYVRELASPHRSVVCSLS